MKAIILASGLGSRLRPLTDEKPKTLIQIGEKELLTHIMDAFLEHEINDFVFTVGYLEQQIREFIASRYPSLQVTYVTNPKYDSTNYIYSLWLARDMIANDEVILIHSDVLFQPDLLERLLREKGSSALVHESQASQKDFNAKIQDGLIKEIGVKVSGPDARFLAPLYKLSKEDFALWMNEADRFVQKQRTSHYMEDAFNEMVSQFALRPVYFQEHEICMEIDDFDDLERAHSLLS